MDKRVTGTRVLFAGATRLTAIVPCVTASSTSETVAGQHMHDRLCSRHAEAVMMTRVLKYICNVVASHS